MKRAKKIPIMKSPDMFRDTMQTFNVKTGERVSYLDKLQLEMETSQPEPDPLPEIKEQLTLF